MRTTILFAACVLALTARTADADMLRCGSKLAQEGMSLDEVFRLCGEPKSKRTVSEPVMAQSQYGGWYQAGTDTKEIWLYERGKGQFPAQLIFVGGILQTINFLKQR